MKELATVAGYLRTACATRLPLLLLMLLPAAGQAQYPYQYYTYMTNGYTITITYPSCASGAVTIPSMINGYPVASIGDDAFYFCLPLTSVTVPDSVTAIDEYAFELCTNLTSVTIPNSVTIIGANAFEECINLTSATIPTSVIYIEDWAFYDCTSLASVTIPDSVTSVGEDAFYDCANLTNAVIGNSVTIIPDNAFAECISLANVVIGNSVTNVGGGAFYDCTSLTSVTIPDSVTSIGGGAFESCSSLTSVTIPNSVTSIESGAFESCSSLTNVVIGNSVTSIDPEAFYDCTSLTIITIPDSVTSIYEGAFDECTSLSAITVDSNNTVYSSVNGVLFDKSQTTLIKCPGGKAGSYTVPDSVTSIGEDAFGTCISLTNVVIGNSVTSIGAGAFGGCSSLTSVTIPDSVTGIGGGAFESCSSLTNVVIGNGVTNIGESAFYECTGLTIITIPDSVTSVGEDAFELCTNLTNVTIGNSVTSIGESAFYECTGLTIITIPDSVASVGEDAFALCTNLTNVTIGNSVTSIGSNTFEYCSSLTNVVIGNSVTNIGVSAFVFCTSLTTVTIPDSVASIGEGAFGGCTSMTCITIPDSVTFIDDYAFTGCSNLAIAYFLGNAPSGDGAYDAFQGDTNATACYLLGTTGWETTFGEIPASPCSGPCTGQAFATVTVRANPSHGGTVSGGGTYPVGTNVQISASANSGWTFTSWSDGGAQTHTITVPSGSATYTANFTQQTAVITVQANPSNGGTVSGGGTYPVGTNVQISASANSGWTFTSWSDGGAQTHTITVPSGGATYTANFAQTATITVQANPSSGGTVSGGGTYPVGTNVQISASANTGWTFTGWSDGNTQNPRTVTVPSGGATYVAQFSQQTATITVQANPSNGGTVNGGGTYPVGTNVQISASANSGWTFTSWSDGGAQTHTITVPSGGATYTANFAQTATITVQANPSSGGTVSGGGTYPVGTNVQISASANSGWTFTSWSDGGAQTHTITVPSGGATYTANFATIPCTYALSTTNANVAASGGGRSFGVTTGSNCAWTASTTNSWINITGGSSGTGNGTVDYTVQTNTAENERIGMVTVDGQTFTVTQAAGGELMGYWKFDEGSGTLTADLSGNGNVGTVQGPTWTNGWSGTGLYFNGTLSDQVVIADSPTLDPTNAITIAAWIYAEDWDGNRRILQKGNRNGYIDDQYTLCAQNGLLQFNLQINPQTTITNVTGSSLPSVEAWHHVAGTYDGSAMRLYVDGQQVAELAISGAIQTTSNPLAIGNKLGSAYASDDFHGIIDEVRVYARALSLSEIQDIACTQYSISPTSVIAPAGGVSGSFNVSAGDECSWSATSSAGWITVTSGSSGTGNGTVSYSLAANTNASEQTGTINIGSQTYSVTEAGTSCTYTLASTNANFGAAGGSCNVSVNASNGCAWMVTSNDPSFITITSGSTGSGTGTVAYTVAPNTSTTSRSGTMTIGTQTFTVAQAGATPVTYSFTNIKQILKTKLDKKTGVTTTNCTITLDLVVQNTGTVETGKSSVLLWLDQGCAFTSGAAATLTEKVKALKEGKSDTIKIKTKKLTGDLAGTFIFATDADTNILAFVQVPSPE